MNNDEISLKELISIILAKWKWIVYPTVIIGVVTTMIMFFFIPRTFVASNQMVYRIPESKSTKYGNYTLPSQAIQDYIGTITSETVLLKVINQLELNLTSEELNDLITIEYDSKTEQQFAVIKTKASNPQEAKDLNDALVSTYITQIQNDYKLDALEQFIYEKTMYLENANFNLLRIQSNIIEKQSFLDSLSTVYTLQKGLFGDPKTAALYADKFNLDLSNMSDDVIIEEYLNQNFLKIESEIVDLKNSEINTKQSIKFETQLLEELFTIKQTKLEVEEYDSLNILYGSIIVSQEAELPTVSESRGVLTNGIIVSILVAMVSVFVVFFMHYWQSTDV